MNQYVTRTNVAAWAVNRTEGTEPKLCARMADDAASVVSSLMSLKIEVLGLLALAEAEDIEPFLVAVRSFASHAGYSGTISAHAAELMASASMLAARLEMI